MTRTIMCAAAATFLAMAALSPAQAGIANAGLNAAAPSAVQQVGWYGGRRWHRWHRHYRHCWRDWRGYRHCAW